jgi:hypothetical protein
MWLMVFLFVKVNIGSGTFPNQLKRKINKKKEAEIERKGVGESRQ